MKRDSAVGIEFRGEQVGQVAAIFNACLLELFQSLIWIADTMHYHAASGKGGSRLNQELLQFAATLVVAPIANPDHVNLAAAADRLKSLYIGSLMECPYPRHAEADPVIASGYAAYLGVPLVGPEGTVHGVLSAFFHAAESGTSGEARW